MARRGAGLHLTKEGRKKLNFTDKLKKKQDEKKYQQNLNKQRKNESSDSGKTTKKRGPYVTKNGKRYLKTSPMGKKIIADQKRKSLASKNYMSKEMIEKRKKRLKIKK